MALRNANRAPLMVSMALAALLASLGCAGEARPAGYDDALRAVRQNIKSPGGVRYRHRFAEAITEALVHAERHCRPVRLPDKRGSMLLYRIGENGKANESIVYPLTEYATCMHERIRDFEVEPPPKPDWWVGIEIPAVQAG